MVSVNMIKQLLYTLLLCLLVAFVPAPLQKLLANIGLAIVIVCGAWLIARALVQRSARNRTVNSSNKAIFVTGCDTGFGHRLAFCLNELGYTVFAGCYCPEGDGAKQLSEKSAGRIKVVPLDVTSDESVQKALQFVQNNLGTLELWALVNNAGVIEYSGLEWGQPGVDHYLKQLDVNTTGVVRVTKSFLPLVRRTANSRVVIVVSCAGRVVGNGLVAYSMSKYAARAFADGLRRELKRWNSRVSVIEPLVYGTNMGNKEMMLGGIRKQWDQTPDEIRDDYGVESFNKMLNCIDWMLDLSHEDIQEVVDTMIEAVTIEEPQYYYRVGYQLEKLICISLNEWLPEEIQDFVCGEDNIALGYRILGFFRRTLNI